MSLSFPIYLDFHATTPVDPRVLEAMLPYFTEHFGNAASRTHAYGWKADAAVETARRQVAALLGASAKEVVFTSGATESNNLAIKGAARALRSRGNHIVTVVTEHKAVLDSCKRLEHEGFEITRLGVGSDGRIDLDQLRDAITERTVLVSVMAANNEIGVLQPIAEIGAIAHERGALMHSDAVQAVGKVPFNVAELPVDLASITAHKFYGPKGAGALYVRRGDARLELDPLFDGGGHERGLRSGTLNVTGIVGLGKACEIAKAEMDVGPRSDWRAARPPAGPLARGGSRPPRERVARASPDEQPERQFSGHLGRVAARRHRRHLRLGWIGVFVRQRGATVRARRARPRSRPCARVAPVRPWPHHDRG